MERLSSLVRLGPSWRRHRIVPFQRPSMTRIIASTGHSPTSFFETGIFFSCTDKYDSTLTLVSIIGFAICRNRGHGICPSLRRRADANLGRLGYLVEPFADPVQHKWTSRVLFV